MAIGLNRRTVFGVVGIAIVGVVGAWLLLFIIPSHASIFMDNYDDQTHEIQVEILSESGEVLHRFTRTLDPGGEEHVEQRMYTSPYQIRATVDGEVIGTRRIEPSHGGSGVGIDITSEGNASILPITA